MLNSTTISNIIATELSQYLCIPREEILTRCFYKRLLKYILSIKYPNIKSSKKEKYITNLKRVRRGIGKKDSIYYLTYQCFEKFQLQKRSFVLTSPILPQSGSVQIYLTARQRQRMYPRVTV
jgi:hypothetical protein